MQPPENLITDWRVTVNCNIFKAAQANGNNGNTELVPGICDNIQDFFNRRSLSSNGLTLTWDAYGQDPRRRAVCGRGGAFCLVQNHLYTVGLGLPGSGPSISSCDEFPFASTEEGGNFFGSLNPPTAASARCVPVYQQNIQGQCNSKSPAIVSQTFRKNHVNPSFRYDVDSVHQCCICR
jgi:hypothetical protein